MRRFGRRIKTMARRHMALTLGLTFVSVGIVGVLALAAVTGAFAPDVPASTTYTFTADWTLLDLERHIEAGEVATISLVTAPAGAPATTPAVDVCAARTTRGVGVCVSL